MEQRDKLKLNMESVALLRNFAETMPIAIGNIVESTQKIMRVYQSVADEVGPHEEQFYDMLMLIKAVQEETADMLQALPPMINNTADKIEDFVRRNPDLVGK